MFNEVLTMPTPSKGVKTHAAHTQPPTVTPKPRPRAKSVYPPMPTDPEAYCRVEQILHFMGIGKSRLYDLIKKGDMPPPLKGGRSSFFKVGKVREAAKKLMEGKQ